MNSPLEPLEVILRFFRTKSDAPSRAFSWTEEAYYVEHDGGDGAVVRFPWHEPRLRPALEALDGAEPSPEVLEWLGAQLREFLRPTNWARDAHIIETALSEGRPVHLTIRSNADELYYLPWELLPLSSKRRFAGLEDCLLRYDVPAKHSPVKAPFPGRILFAYASGGRGVPAAAHLAAIEGACRKAGVPFDRERDVLHEVSRKSLAEKLDETDRPVTALHLLCHGSQVGETAYGLSLGPVDSVGVPDPLSAVELRDVLFSRARQLRLVTLCACQGGDAGTPAHPLGSVARMFHEQGVPAVIASRMPLSCEGSVLLTEALYGELFSERGSLRTALSAARRRLKEELRSRDWLSLQFYARAGDVAALYPFRPPPSLPADKPGRELVLIRHEAYKKVIEEPESFADPAFLAGRRPRWVELDQTQALEQREWEWKNLEAEVKRLASPEGELRRAFSERETDVVYYGFPHVPLAVLAGYLSKKRPVQVLECLSDRFSWDTGASGPHPPLEVDEVQRRETGSFARLRFSVSVPVGIEDCRQVLPDEDVKLELHFRVPSPKRDSVRREEQLADYVQIIRNTLNQYILSNATSFEGIHIFAAVPVSLAFHLGRELAATSWMPKCFVYNYGLQESPRYKWRLGLHDAERGRRSIKIFK
ncbi:hypothetical protein BO221_16505 [Archangium sp. Cb G35]|uniref:SAVED domain-containing protein n=1 Tax=Archangium sp. Cb G35 TaxID=1920190 RepID=UPI00093736AF|nr:SAVED domain-containing protein [Archangium sp. Cb G35]OJT23602.1 hypothetical protein BO221_16505 [Archangium sp. Cb G35]